MDSIVDKKTGTMDPSKMDLSEGISQNMEKQIFPETKREMVSSIINKNIPKKSTETKKKSSKKQKVEKIEDEDEDEDYGEMEERSEDESDAGSLNEFIVNEESDDSESDDGSVDDEKELTTEEKTKKDLEDISESNIVSGKRVRKPVKRFEDSVFNSDEYKKMILCDIPDDELDAVFSSESEEEMSDEEDGEYDGPEDDEDNSSEEESEDYEESENFEESEGPEEETKPKKKK